MTARVETWIKQLTLEEKASLCAGADIWRTYEVERLGIPSLFMADGPHGIRKENKDVLLGEPLPATCFPTGSALGATWNTELLEEIGSAIGKECNRLGVHLLLGPGINMKRSPLNGRNFEYYSEDPYLTGELGAAFINGVQSQGVGATLKHFACNNSEFERMTISSELDERTLREIYLAAFERIVLKAQPWSIMTAYNKVNGTYASENRYLLNNILRDEWSFQGFVLSDWLAVNDRVLSLKAGLEVEMPGPAASSKQQLVEAVISGRLEETLLDDSVRRLLQAVERSMDRVLPNDDWEAAAHHALARKAAAESIVLLKNDGILPLRSDKIRSLAVIGQFAQSPLYQGGGSSKVNPALLDVPLEEIRKLAGEQTVVHYEDGYDEQGSTSDALISEAVRLAADSEVALLFVGIAQGESEDRKHLYLPEGHIRLIQAVSAVQRNCVVILNNGSAVDMRSWIASVPAVIEAWLPGQAGGGAIADILFGAVNPSGKLSETFPERLSHNPSYLSFPGENGRAIYGEGLFVGYRYYDKKEIQPLFPFGHGLSYTAFHYHHLTLDHSHVRDTDTLTVMFDVTNTGTRPGKEVAQLYIRDAECPLVRPEKELKRFAKVSLKPGETGTVIFTLEFRDFCYYDPRFAQWKADSGWFDIIIGSSSRDIRLSESFYLETVSKSNPVLDMNSTVKEWLQTGSGRQAIRYAGEFNTRDSNLKADIAADQLQPFYLHMPLYKFMKLLGMSESENDAFQEMLGCQENDSL